MQNLHINFNIIQSQECDRLIRPLVHSVAYLSSKSVHSCAIYIISMIVIGHDLSNTILVYLNEEHNYLLRKVEENKAIIRSCKPKKCKYVNGEKRKKTNDDEQNSTQKTKDRGTRTPLKHGD